MPYYSRQRELNRSLQAYREFYPDIEISICDDGSPEPVVAPGCTVTRLPTKDYVLNPCVPMNRAVEASSGDVIVLTNPEIEHREPIFGRMLESLSENRYVIAACMNDNGRWISHSSIQGGGARSPMPGGSGFHFCAMLHRSMWNRAGGFDEDYRDGWAHEDNDWLWRLENIGAEFVMRDDLVVYHHRTRKQTPRGGTERNRALLYRKWGHKWSRS